VAEASEAMVLSGALGVVIFAAQALHMYDGNEQGIRMTGVQADAGRQRLIMGE